jgi:putative drug exporter of the RND superfamily
VISPQTLAKASARRPWLTVAVWLVAIGVAVVLSGAWLGDALTTDMSYTSNPESKRADALIEQRLRGPEPNIELVIVRSPVRTVGAQVFRVYVGQLQRDITALGPQAVKAAASYYQTGDSSLVSRDRHTTLITVKLPADNEAAHKVIPRLRAVLDRHRNAMFQTLTFGRHSVGTDIDKVSKRDLAKGEKIGILVALVILLAVFGAVVAGIIPILMALTSITLATGIVAVVGRLFSFTFFVEQMIAMMGLALGIDYSLFVISRYREERHRGAGKLTAIGTTGGTASRAVAVSGITVVLALLGMLTVPMTMLRSLAAGAIFVAITSVLAALTLLPALLALLGDRINALRVLRHKRMSQARAGGFWDHVSHAVMRRPIVSVLTAAGVLVIAAIPAFGIKLGFPGPSMLPNNTESRQAYAILAQDFSGGQDLPVEIAVDANLSSPNVQAGIDRLRGSLAGDHAFGPSKVERNAPGDFALVSAPTAADPDSDTSVQAVERLRDRYIPAAFAGTHANVLVGGATARDKDGYDIINHYLPIVLLLVLGMSFLLLTVVFRSIVVAVKAIVMNLLSVGAAYGLLVFVFQDGHGAGVLGLRQGEFIAAWLPLFLFAVLFGLSMDYHVFLLTRIREHYDQTGDNTAAVAHGLRSTAGIITGAALIMVAVFAGFASGQLTEMQQMGFGLGLAVLIDATIVRTVLVPASMRLLGTWNWYLPRWLRWLPQLRVEAAEAPTVLQPKAEHATPGTVDVTAPARPSSHVRPWRRPHAGRALTRTNGARHERENV